MAIIEDLADASLKPLDAPNLQLGDLPLRRLATDPNIFAWCVTGLIVDEALDVAAC